MFTSTEHRLIHLNGYYKLVEARIASGDDWGPFKVLVVHYLHSFCINVLSHFTLFVGDKDIHYVNDVIDRFRLNQGGLGREIVGVPAELTIAVYKLCFLLQQNAKQPPWDSELDAVARLIENWHPPTYSLAGATGILVVGKLYHLACICFLLYLQDRNVDLTDDTIRDTIKEAVEIVNVAGLCKYPYNCVSWPLTVLGLFAEVQEHRQTLQGPLLSLVENEKMNGYQTAIDLLETAWSQKLGPRVLDDKALMANLSI